MSSDAANHTNDLIARRFIDEYPIHGHDATIPASKTKMSPAFSCLYVEDQDLIYVYKDGVYTMIPDEKLHGMVYRFTLTLKKHTSFAMKSSQNITMGMISDIIRQIKLQLQNRTDTLRSNYITFNDGYVLDLNNFSLEKWSRAHHSIFKLDAPSNVYRNPQPPKKWLAFLDEVLVLDETGLPDKNLIAYMQEFFGYALLDTSELEQAFFLYGSGANGKSVVLNILKAMFPSEVVSAATLNSLTNNRFALGNLRGKRLNITNEEESKYVKSDIFKKLVTGEEMEADRKFETEVKIQPRIKLIFATNKMPKLDGVENAIRRRLKIVPFYAEIPYEKQNPQLVKELLEELPHIIVWAIQGARRLIENKMKMAEPECLSDTMEEFEEGQSSVVEFMNENFIVTGNEVDNYKRADLYDEYKDWCDDRGRATPSYNTFVGELRVRYKQAGLALPKKVVWHKPSGRPVRGITGIKRTDDKSAWINSRGL